MLVELLDGPRYAGTLAEVTGNSFANASNHVACLRDCGLVVDHTEGRHVSSELANSELADSLLCLARCDLTATCDCQKGRWAMRSECTCSECCPCPWLLR